jgi:hypothetical protein
MGLVGNTVEPIRYLVGGAVLLAVGLGVAVGAHLSQGAAPAALPGAALTTLSPADGTSGSTGPAPSASDAAPQAPSSDLSEPRTEAARPTARQVPPTTSAKASAPRPVHSATRAPQDSLPHYAGRDDIRSRGSDPRDLTQDPEDRVIDAQRRRAAESVCAHYGIPRQNCDFGN